MENKSWLSLIFSGGAGFAGIEPTKPTDAVSGASQWGGRGGVRAEMNLAGQYIETGVDYSYLASSVTYRDGISNIDGTRSFAMQAITLPVMYNLHFFNRKDGNPNLVCGIGVFGSCFPYQTVAETGTLSN